MKATTKVIPKPQQGFTLLELMVAMVLFTAMLTMVSSAVTPALNFYARIDTDNRLKDIKAALTAAYNANAMTVDAQATQVFTTADGTLTPLAPNTNGQCVGNSTLFVALKRYLSSSSTEIWHDGFGRSFCVYLTARLSDTFNGTTYYYHNIAVVSPGIDGTIDSGTSLASNGTLNVGGDDRCLLIDGRSLMLTKVSQSWDVLTQFTSVYQNYFNTRYLSNTTRDVSIDYFAQLPPSWGSTSNWDSAGYVASTNGSAQLVTYQNTHTWLGLSSGDVVDGFGQTIMFDNSSDTVRNPDNRASASLQTPPYTAQVYTTLPGGSKLFRTATGTY